MLKAVLFGAGGGGARLYKEISVKYEIIAFVDNDKSKWGDYLYGIPIYDPVKCIDGLEYDYIIITSAPGMDSIKIQCLRMGIGEEKILTSYIEMPLESRRIFLKNFAGLLEEFKEDGECAEAGVFERDFAKWINYYFPNKRLHLFDTFNGFSAKDIEKEGDLSKAKEGDYSHTSVETVMEKMFYPQRCIVHKGYFPETAQDITDNFCFVNLDLDLYEPTYNGLKYFSTRLTKNGIILIHDYFAENFKGPKKAVDRFVKEHNGKVKISPIGDGISIMLIKV